MTTFPIVIAARHMHLTDSMRRHVEAKVDSLKLGALRITDAKVVLDAQMGVQVAEIILYCAHHTTLEAKTGTDNLYTSVDLTIEKIKREINREKALLERWQGRATGRYSPGRSCHEVECLLDLNGDESAAVGIDHSQE